MFHVEVSGKSAGVCRVEPFLLFFCMEGTGPERGIDGNCKSPYLRTRMPAFNRLLLIRKVRQATLDALHSSRGQQCPRRYNQYEQLRSRCRLDKKRNITIVCVTALHCGRNNLGCTRSLCMSTQPPSTTGGKDETSHP